MAKRQRLSKAQLLERFSDEGLRTKVLDLLDLRTFLAHSIIRANYRIPDELNSCLVLSEYGDELLRELGKKGVPIKEGRLLCFLEFYHLDLLMNPSAMDVESLAAAIGQELMDGSVLLPFVHGPLLYEKAASLFPDERSYLGTSDTLRLLENTPVGVFQTGHRLSGPYGMLTSDAVRAFSPTTRIPLQHCHDVSCRKVHHTQLWTDSTAPINEHRPVASKALETQSEDPSEFALFFAEIAKDSNRFYDDFNASALAILIGEALADDELIELLMYLLDNTGGRLRALVGALGLHGPAKTLASGLDRAQALQLILLVDDRTLLTSIDALVFADVIIVPEGEVRRPVLFENASAGAFSLTPELSMSGVRVQPYHRPLGPLRLRRLVDEIYRSTDASEISPGQIQDTEELGWQLRGINGVNVLARLDEYLRTENPEHVLGRLVLARRQSVELAAKQLGLSLREEIEDSTLVERMLWKLGFDTGHVRPLHERFWLRHERMSHSARSASVSTIVDQEAMRGLGANYFVALEELLADTLAFSAWVLLSDHAAAKQPFRYDNVHNRASGLSALTDFHAYTSPEGREPLAFDEKSTLYALCEGFGVLAAKLESVQGSPEEWLRPAGAYPAFAGKTRLQHFPFRHAAVFLDLTPSSQQQILSLLRESSRELVNAKVSEVRNEQLHYRRSSADLDKLIKCLAAVEQVVQRLEDAGLTRSMFYPDRKESDRWGRSTVYFSDRRGREIALGQPTSYMWLNLPSLAAPQYLVTSAQFAEPNEVLRVTLAADSSFRRMWGNFPSRRQSSRREDNLAGDVGSAAIQAQAALQG